MTRVQTIKTKSGEEDDDDEDVAFYDARKAAMARNGEAPLPAAVNTVLMRGDSLLRALRRWRGLSQTAVAKQAGLGQGYLSDLESRRRTGTPETLAALAAALGVPAGWLIGGLDSDRVLDLD